MHLPGIALPDIIEVGLKVARIGRSSVPYEIGIFRKGATDCAAHGYFVHVYADAPTQRPAPIPLDYRAFLEGLR